MVDRQESLQNSRVHWSEAGHSRVKQDRTEDDNTKQRTTGLTGVLQSIHEHRRDH